MVGSIHENKTKTRRWKATQAGISCIPNQRTHIMIPNSNFLTNYTTKSWIFCLILSL